jgi:D-aspartate ligase
MARNEQAQRPGGVVILGGAHGAMALARSLGRQNIPVWLISNDHPLPGWSRRVAKMIRWCGPKDRGAVKALQKLGKQHRLDGFLLVPAADADIRFVSENKALLAKQFRIVLPDWDALATVVDKPLLYRRADELGIAVPKTYDFRSVEDSAAADIQFPVILKPDMGGGTDAFSKAKVVRADDRAAFLEIYRNAASLIGLENVVVQELIPGGGRNQLSYAALWFDGAPVAAFTARRSRQFPVEFGYTSTFVEVVREPEVIEISERLLGSIGFTGLVEIEFKRDPRNGTLKLLDVNPRPWAWFGLASACGVDLGAMLWQKVTGQPVDAAKDATEGAAWMYLPRDLAAAAMLIGKRRLTPRDYLRSFASVRTWAVFDRTDPMPALIDMPLTAWRVITKRLLRLK